MYKFYLNCTLRSIYVICFDYLFRSILYIHRRSLVKQVKFSDARDKMDIFIEKEKDKLLQSLVRSIDSAEHNDVEIILEDGVIKASKLILSTRSEYFEKMFNKSSQFSEQKESSVQFPCKKLIMKKILEHLYGGNLAVSGLTCSEKIELLNMLRYLLLQDAHRALENYLRDQLKTGKIPVKESLDAVEIAHSFKLELATDLLVDHISLNLDILLSDHTEIISTLPKVIFLKITREAADNDLDEDPVKPLERLKFVEQWLLKNRESLTKKEMRRIRYSFDISKFEVHDLLGDVKNSKLFQDEDIFDAVKRNYMKVKMDNTKLNSKNLMIIFMDSASYNSFFSDISYTRHLIVKLG